MQVAEKPRGGNKRYSGQWKRDGNNFAQLVAAIEAGVKCQIEVM